MQIARPVKVLRYPCCYCDDMLEFRKPVGLEPFAAADRIGTTWLHASTGGLYGGECLCEGQPHTYSHNAFGFLVCRTWSDSHCAIPRRS